MADFYDVDYGEKTRELLPPDKRRPLLLSYVKALAAPLQYLRDLWLGDYRTGSTGAVWVASTPYMKGDRVIHNGSAYESLADNNQGNEPPDAESWILVQENFIGLSERIKYNGFTLVLEYALNKYFMTTFRQPPNRSDIYLVVSAKPVAVFVAGFIESQSSDVFLNTSSEFVVNKYSFSDYYNLSIFVPQTVFDALDPNPDNREKIIRLFADKYVNAGIRYTVKPY